MTQDEIIAMAKEAGFIYSELSACTYRGNFAQMERFAALVAAYEQEALCAELNRQIDGVRYHCSDATKRDVAERVLLDGIDAIRARSAA